MNAEQIFREILRFVRDLDLDYLEFLDVSGETTEEVLQEIGHSANKFERVNIRLVLNHTL